MKSTISIILFTAVIVMADDKKSHTIQTPSGEVAFKEVTVPGQKKFNDTITELTPTELSALERDTKRIPTFIAAFVLPEHLTSDTLEDLDLAFAAWLRSNRRDAFTSEDVIRIVGCALGAHATQHLGVRWARVTDTHGSEITGVRGRVSIIDCEKTLEVRVNYLMPVGGSSP